MKPKWLLEADVFEENLDDIRAAITSQGMEYKMINYVPFDGLDFTDFYDPTDCVVAYGSLGLIRQLLRKTKWIPGAWCNLDVFKCQYYYPRLAQYLLNSNYVMLPYGELNRQKDLLFDAVGSNDSLFIRPSNGYKTFTGKVVNRETYSKDVDFFGFYDVEPEELVVVAEPKNIREEWRLVVVNKRVVASSLYKDWGVNRTREGCPDEVLVFADEVISTWQPETCWVLDICSTKHSGLRVVEINSFSSSGLYACNKNDVVAAVSNAAVLEFKDFY